MCSDSSSYLDELKRRIMDAIGSVRDPDHTETIRELGIVLDQDIEVREIQGGFVATVLWQPTCHTCPHASNMGLCMRFKLKQEFKDTNIKIDILLKDHGSKVESNYNLVDKQINDKERVAAALENTQVIAMIKEST